LHTDLDILPRAPRLVRRLRTLAPSSFLSLSFLSLLPSIDAPRVSPRSSELAAVTLPPPCAFLRVATAASSPPPPVSLPPVSFFRSLYSHSISLPLGEWEVAWVRRRARARWHTMEDQPWIHGLEVPLARENPWSDPRREAAKSVEGSAIANNAGSGSF
jgi:hypothetical protein